MSAAKHNGRRLCLFGGTFDPIHSAHLRIAEEARRKFALDRVLFVPAGSPPHKVAAGVTPYEDRLRMVEIACQPYPYFEVSTLEKGEGQSFTVDTVERFRETIAPEDRLYFLIGADAFDEIESWNRWQELVAMIDFIVVTRPGGKYNVPPGARIHRLEGLELAVSSSAIRLRLSQHKLTPELPAKVREFIDSRGLYRFEDRITASP